MVVRQMKRIIAFIRNHWFRALLSTALIIWTIVTIAWLFTADAVPLYVWGHAFYDLIIEGVIAISLWLDVILKKRSL